MSKPLRDSHDLELGARTTTLTGCCVGRRTILSFPINITDVSKGVIMRGKCGGSSPLPVPRQSRTMKVDAKVTGVKSPVTLVSLLIYLTNTHILIDTLAILNIYPVEAKILGC